MYQGFCNELLGQFDPNPFKRVAWKAPLLPQYSSTLWVARFKTYGFWAYKYLGFGLHAVMDSTSPAHEDFKLWVEGSAQAREHGAWVYNPFTTIESHFHAGRGNHEVVTIAAMRSYLNMEKCACE